MRFQYIRKYTKDFQYAVRCFMKTSLPPTAHFLRRVPSSQHCNKQTGSDLSWTPRTTGYALLTHCHTVFTLTGLHDPLSILPYTQNNDHYSVERSFLVHNFQFQDISTFQFGPPDNSVTTVVIAIHGSFNAVPLEAGVTQAKRAAGASARQQAAARQNTPLTMQARGQLSLCVTACRL